MKTTVVIPAFNEARTIAQVIRAVKPHVDEVIVVDDGSEDASGTIARQEGAIVFQHLINRGLGGALGTGIAAALLRGATHLATYDADGQHDPTDLLCVLEPIWNGRADVVVGSRLLGQRGMPLLRRFYNQSGNILTFLLFGLWTTDSQSGLRAFTRNAASKLQLRTNRMEVSSEIIKEIRLHHFRFIEVPIRPIYTRYSLTKGQGFIPGIKTFVRLILLRIVK